MSVDAAIARLEAWADYEEDALRRAPTFAEEEAHRCRAENYSEVIRLVYNDPKFTRIDALIEALEEISDASAAKDDEWLIDAIEASRKIVSAAKGN